MMTTNVASQATSPRQDHPTLDDLMGRTTLAPSMRIDGRPYRVERRHDDAALSRYETQGKYDVRVTSPDGEAADVSLVWDRDGCTYHLACSCEGGSSFGPCDHRKALNACWPGSQAWREDVARLPVITARE